MLKKYKAVFFIHFVNSTKVESRKNSACFETTNDEQKM